MKVAIINKWPGGALHNVFKPLAKELGYEYICITDFQKTLAEGGEFDVTFSKYDVIHFTYYQNIGFLPAEPQCPYTISAHHFTIDNRDRYMQTLSEYDFARIVVPEHFIQRQLGQNGIGKVIQIPYSFDHTGFKPTPYPKEFTVGIMGCPAEQKRHHIVKEACKRVGVRCLEFTRPADLEDDGWVEQEAIYEFYKSISVLVCASWVEGGPLPPQEAMLCGRPVITTPVGMMLDERVNKYPALIYFDGSVRNLVERLNSLAHFTNEGWFDPDVLAKNASGCLWHTSQVAPKWKKMWKEVILEWE